MEVLRRSREILYHPLKELLNSLHESRVTVLDEVHWSTRMEPIIEVKRRVPSGLRWMVVDCELHGGQ